MSWDFAHRTVIVTGAAHGLGRAIADAFKRADARVWACGINPAEDVTRVDVTNRVAVAGFVSNAEAASGAVAVLVNNAGGALGQVGRPLEEVSEADWEEILKVNLTGAFNCTQAVTPGMKRARFGRIVNISSGAGLSISLTGIQAYASAKAGQIGLTRQLAQELGPWGITANSVAPGFVRSNPTTERQWAAMGTEGQQRLVESIATRRLGTPDDIAHAVLFFASDQAGGITGQTLSVDGGRIFR